MKTNNLAVPLPRWQQILLWICMVAGILMAGVAFIYKIAEFIFTIGSKELQGFADAPIMVYFVVAAGWICLLIWNFMTGAFKNVEQVKMDMLEMEKVYEQRGE